MTVDELKSYLSDLVGRIETYSYEFDLELTRFFEKEQDLKGMDLMKCTVQLIAEEKTDEAFACLYLFTIYLKRDNNIDGLEKVVTDYEDVFPEEKYPLILELKSRYLKRRKNDIDSWKKALECDKKALKLLHGVFFAGSTYGINASYVSTLCRILEHGAKHSQDLCRIKEFISEDDCAEGVSCISDNIKSNPDYAKNYFLKAQLLYYRMIVFDGEPDRDPGAVNERCEYCDGMIAEISEAIKREHIAAKRETYRSFCRRISEYQSYLASSVADKVLSEIDSSPSFERCIDPMCHACPDGGKYAFICYSRVDYKAVFKDIYTLYCKNVAVKFDRIVKSGSKWASTVEEAILDKDCAVVIFYMSSDALISDSIYKELSIVSEADEPNRKKYFFISVQGDTASKLLYDTYKNNDYDPLFKNTLTPDRISRLLSFFNDAIHFISRTESDYERKLISDIRHYLDENSAAVMKKKNTAGGSLDVRTYYADNDRIFDGIKKPNEDHLIADRDNGVFIVADGVTRPHGEYGPDGKSSAYDVTVLFCETAYRCVISKLSGCSAVSDVTKLLKEAFVKGNDAAAGITDKNEFFRPATVALCAVIFKGELCFAYIGDCSGVLIRGGCRYVFAERQTEAVSRLGLSKEELYNNYINKPGKKFAYGVINGDPLASAFVVTSHMRLEDGDKVIVATDGLTDALLYESTVILNNPELSLLIPSVSACYDNPPFAGYADDKAMIDIVFRKE